MLHLSILQMQQQDISISEDNDGDDGDDDDIYLIPWSSILVLPWYQKILAGGLAPLALWWYFVSYVFNI